MKKLLLAAIAATIATAASAGPNNIEAGGGTGPLKVQSAMLAIKSPASKFCPSNATMRAWIYTNKAGPVTYMIIRHGQGAGTPKTIMAKKANGKYVAEISQVFPIHQPTDAQYRIAARGAGDYSFSNWAPLKASCAF